jgi:hypothetical protein
LRKTPVSDFLFVYGYLIRFAGESPSRHSALDIKTYASALLKKGYRESLKGNRPKRTMLNFTGNRVSP